MRTAMRMNATGSSSRNSNKNNNNSNSAVSSWSDWMAESCGMDNLFGCSDGGGCGGVNDCVAPASMRRPSANGASGLSLSSNTNGCLLEVDYEQLHDEFLESLLAEQSQLSRNHDEAGGIQRTSSELTTSTVATMSTVATAATQSNPVPPDPPGATVMTAIEPADHATTPRKRRRPLGLVRGSRSTNAHASHASTTTSRHPSPPRIRVAPRRQVSITSTRSECSTRSVVSLGALADAQADLLEPSTYLHAQCRLQKDRGRGEDVGASLCAKGRDACLEKLRAKMRLLTEVVLDTQKGPATMKRRKARMQEPEHDDHYNFVETRSLIELKMGFLSMTYGVLLRWDKAHTGQVTLVVLRKCCHESFYPKARRERDPVWRPTTMTNASNYNATTTPLPAKQPASSPTKQPSSLLRDVIGNKHAILQRQDGTEVELLEPPYRVPRPAVFDPSVLTVTALYATGLSKKSNWTVKLSYQGQSESILLAYDEEQHCFTPKLGQALSYSTGTSDMSLGSSLELTLYEHRLRRRSYRRHILTMVVPLINMEAQPSSSRKMTRVTVPCKHDDDATIALGVLFKSDHFVWLKQELDLRRRQETAPASSFLPWRRCTADESVEDVENRDPWDWIYSICVC